MLATWSCDVIVCFELGYRLQSELLRGSKVRTFELGEKDEERTLSGHWGEVPCDWTIGAGGSTKREEPANLVSVYYEQGTCFRCFSSSLGFLKLWEELWTCSENEVLCKCQGFADPRLRIPVLEKEKERIPVLDIFAMITSFLNIVRNSLDKCTYLPECYLWCGGSLILGKRTKENLTQVSCIWGCCFGFFFSCNIQVVKVIISYKLFSLPSCTKLIFYFY